MLRPYKLALTLSFFFLSTFTSASLTQRDGWRPDTERPGAPFILGNGKNEGVKVVGYEGEWPLWSSFHADEKKQAEGAEAIDAVAPAGRPSPSSSHSHSGSGNKTMYVCAGIGECAPCPEDVIHLPYCRPYNNRRRVACAPVIGDKSDSGAVEKALAAASSASSTTRTTTITTSSSGQDGAVMLGYEACGKSAKLEARDYFEMIAVVASIAIFSVWTFVQRQKTLFVRQNNQLQYRVSGLPRRSSGLPAPTPTSSTVQSGNRKKRAARLAPPLSSSRS